MKKPIYFYINRPTCRRHNQKAAELSDALSLYKDLIITPEAAERLAKQVKEKTDEVNGKYKRGKPFHIQRTALLGDTWADYNITVSDGTDNPVLHIHLNPIYTIITS